MSCPEAFPRQKNGVTTRMAVPRETPNAENHRRRPARASNGFGPCRGNVISRSCHSHGSGSAPLRARAAGCAHLAVERSEERRVGKECRSRWAREHGTTKGENEVVVGE